MQKLKLHTVTNGYVVQSVDDAYGVEQPVHCFNNLTSLLHWLRHNLDKTVEAGVEAPTPVPPTGRGAKGDGLQTDLAKPEKLADLTEPVYDGPVTAGQINAELEKINEKFPLTPPYAEKGLDWPAKWYVVGANIYEAGIGHNPDQLLAHCGSHMEAEYTKNLHNNMVDNLTNHFWE
jgi:hypothetical protein